MNLELIYNSAACNATVKALDWGKNDLICYASCNSVIIYNPKNPGTNKDLKILVGHIEKVCVAKWIKKSTGIENELISTSNDATAIVWSYENDKYVKNVLKGHSDGINRADCIYTDAEKGSLIVVTAAIDSKIKIWKRGKYRGDFENIQTIDLSRGLCVGVCLQYLPNTNNLILACGRDTSTIELYVQENSESTEFKLLQVLKDHENWVPGVDFCIDDKEDLLLASGSQDKFIRLWRISELKTENDETNKLSITTKFSIKDKEVVKEFTTKLESVLCGHEGWVYEVQWSPKIGDSQPMRLMSCSLDKTIIIWTLDETSGLWTEKVRVGEIGGNTLGFYGCKYSPDAQSIIGHGYQGSFHLWNYCSITDKWEPGVSPSGHSNQVVDIAWEPRGMYLMSISTDQTNRIHAPWVRENKVSWHEIARPQVHGYDMSCLTVISAYKFASGAEEKIFRIFEAPSNFYENFQNICNFSEKEEFITASKSGPKGASVPSLGLSNKAVFESSNESQAKPSGKENYPEETYFREVHLKAPPTEEDLIQNTLWPEVQKLYGHGFDTYSLASSHDGKILATACKSSTPLHSSVLLWDTEEWQKTQLLASHILTVTQIVFSPNDKKILTVSRDRRMSIFERLSSNHEYYLVATTDKKTGVHTRIIWGGAWTHDSIYCATVSRDGKIVMWTKNHNVSEETLFNYYTSIAFLDLRESITAIDFAPHFVDDEYLFCIGFESGNLSILKWSVQNDWTLCLRIANDSAHHSTVKRLHFRPVLGQAGHLEDPKILQLATCGADHAVKIHDLHLN